MSEAADAPAREIEARSRGLFVARLLIGLAQGAALYLLYRAFDAQSWPATDGLVFAPLLLVSLYVPLLLIQGLGEMRLITLLIWAALAAAILAALAWYDIWSAWPRDWTYLPPGQYGWRPHIWPSSGLFVFGAAGLFIAHALIAGGDADRRFMARYETHFDVAWKLAVQLALSLAFVGAFWLLLWLGSELFKLIGLDFFERLLQHRWFSIPATTLAFAAALHLTDVQPALVRGTRTLALLLLSWLLPLLTLIVAGFLVGLVFTGLGPLWKIGHASALLLTAAAVLIVLINAAHQDGAPERAPPTILRIAGSLAAVTLVPIVGLAAHAILLRVQQYGWTAERVAVAACVVIAGSYAVGYVIAATPSGSWLKRIEMWNFCTALLILAVLLALFTPLADPKRIAVGDQVSRLSSGKVKPQAFDFSYLRWSGGRYGKDALQDLARSKDAAIRDAAAAALKSTDRYTPPPASIPDIVANVTVYPKGRSLPKSFAGQSWQRTNFWMPECLLSAEHSCDAVLADVDGDGRDEILLFGENGRIEYPTVFADDGRGHWSMIGHFSGSPICDIDFQALRDGRYTTPPAAHRDLEINGRRFAFEPMDVALSCKR